MSRALTRAYQLAIDLLVLVVAFAAGFFFRFDGLPPLPWIGRILFLLPYVIAFEYAVLVAFGVHRLSWRYIGLRDLGRIFAALSIATIGLVISRVLLEIVRKDVYYIRHGLVPYSVIASNFVVAFLGITGARVLRRTLGERAEARLPNGTPRKEQFRTMLVGAGQAGVLVAREIASRRDLGLRAVGFLDDDLSKIGSVIHGLPVLGTTDRLADLCARHEAEEVLITMANVPGATIRRIREQAEAIGLPTKIIPGLYEIVGGTVNLSRIRTVAIEDLLGRDAVELDDEAISGFLHDRVVLVTGAGGSIGSEICRQACRFKPRTIVLVERSENALFYIHQELTHTHPEVSTVPCVADVTDHARMDELFRSHRPSAVFHSAAHKHVPMMEWNPSEAVKNNVFGSKTVADLSHAHGAATFVLISTDKAVNPTSVMGATKRVAEIYVQGLSSRSKTRFVTVRFGNVLGSAGSVIPIFREQIARGGPVTVTHPEMTRYFMTIPEACQLVLQAGTMGQGGEIFILDMGAPVKIVDLARDLIELSGLRPGEDVEIVFTGVRPGEKLFEELSTDAEHADRTRHPKVFVGLRRSDPDADLAGRLEVVGAAALESRHEEVRQLLRQIVPEFRPPDERAAASTPSGGATSALPLPAATHGLD